MPTEVQGILIGSAKEAAKVSRLSLYECALLQGLERSRDQNALARLMGKSRADIRRELRKVHEKLDICDSREAKRFAREHIQELQQRRRRLMLQGALKFKRSRK